MVEGACWPVESKAWIKTLGFQVVDVESSHTILWFWLLEMSEFWSFNPLKMIII